jgi:hypothetical protein
VQAALVTIIPLQPLATSEQAAAGGPWMLSPAVQCIALDDDGRPFGGRVGSALGIVTSQLPMMLPMPLHELSSAVMTVSSPSLVAP